MQLNHPTLSDIKPKGAAVLMALRQAAPCTNRVLSALTGLTGKTITSALGLLGQFNLVVRGVQGWMLTASAQAWFEPGRNFYAIDPVVKLRESVSQDIEFNNPLTDSLKTNPPAEIFPQEGEIPPCSLDDFSVEEKTLLHTLKSQGIYHNTAVQLIQEHEPDDIRLQLLVYKWAVDDGAAHGPGYLVMAIREDWEIPYGYDPGIPKDKCPDCEHLKVLCRCRSEWL